MKNQIEQARLSGYSDEEIINHLESSKPELKPKIQSAKSSNYANNDILNYLSTDYNKPISNRIEQTENKNSSLTEMAKSAAIKPMRVAMQPALGAVEMAMFPYDIASTAATAMNDRPGVIAGQSYQMAAEEAANLIEKSQSQPLNEQEKIRLNYFENQVRNPELAQQVANETPSLPDLSSRGAIRAAGNALGVNTEPEGVIEKTARLGGTLREAGVKGFQETAKAATSKLEKYLSPKLMIEAEKLAATAPLSSGAVAAHELLGVPEWATFAGLATGKVAWEGGKKAASNLGKKYFLFDPTKLDIKSPIQSFKNELRNSQREAYKQFKEGILDKETYELVQPFLETASKFGIPVDPASLTKSAYFKNVQNLVNTNALTEDAAQKFRQEAADSWANSYLKAIENMEMDHIYKDKGSVADALLTDVTRARHKELSHKARTAYTESELLFQGAERVNPEGIQEIEDSLNRVYQKSQGSLIPTTSEQQAKGIAEGTRKNLFANANAAGREELAGLQFSIGQTEQQLKEQTAQEVAQAPGQKRLMQGKARNTRAEQITIQDRKEAEKQVRKLLGEEAQYINFDENGKLLFAKNITPQQLVKTIRSLNKVMDWDNPNVLNLFNDTKTTLNKVLDKQYGTTNKKALESLREGNNLFQESQRLFGNDSRWKKWGLKSDALPEDLLRTINTLDRFKAFEKDFGGTEQGRHLIDYMKRLHVEEKLAPMFEKHIYQPGSIAANLKRIERDPFMQYMMPQETKSNLNQLAKLDQQIERQSPRFYKSVQNNPELGDMLNNIFAYMNPKTLMIKLGNNLRKDQLSKAYSQILFNPNITNEMNDIGKSLLKDSSANNIRLQSARTDQLRETIVAEIEPILKAGGSQFLTNQ